MPKLLLVLIILACSTSSKGQFFYDDGPLDSFVIKFDTDTSHYSPDTANVPLWQFGGTYKSFFGSDTSKKRMTTDTLSGYPIGANNFFLLRIPHVSHTLITFWHRYQTDSTKDGGLVEYSNDHGLSWSNVKGACNIDGGGLGCGGILTDSFYSSTDFVSLGGPCFNGTCGSTRKSAFQFAGCPGVKSTAGPGCSFYDVDTLYIRFRFVSDSTPDTLAGWAIDSVKVNYYLQSGYVDQHNPGQMKVVPNPSENGKFNLPRLADSKNYLIEITGTMGQLITRIPYTESLDLSTQPPGIYFYQIKGLQMIYSGILYYR